MSTKLVHRPARTTAPMRETESYTLDAPPPVEGGKSGPNMMSLIPLLGAGVSMTVMMLFRGSSLAAIGALMMIVTVLASIIMMISQRGKQGRARREQRENYLEYLERSRTILREEEQKARRVARISSPPPGALFDVIRSRDRLWERRRANEDFLHVRLGTGQGKSREIKVTDQGSALQQSDTFMTTELEILKNRFEYSPALPIAVPLDSVGTVSVVGSREFTLSVVRNLLSQAAAFHSPEDLHLAIATGEETASDFEWARWLPHLADQRSTHKTGPVRRIAPSMNALSDLLAEDMHSRSTVAAESRKNYLNAGVGTHLARLLVVADNYGELPEELHIPDKQSSSAALGISTLHLVRDRLEEPSEVTVRISQDLTSDDANAFVLEDFRQDPVAPETSTGTLDALSVATASALSRELAPLRLSADSLEHDSSENSQGFLEMLGLSPRLDAEDLRRLWQPRSEIDFLRVPLGPDDRGKPAVLDLKESAQFGMGPHGLCVGATGSGKSEMLRSLVLGLLATHSPDVVSTVLIDYKGGATFAPFVNAPHVAGVITNLSDDVSLIERVYASLSGEIQRRQEVLKAAGNLANITDYQLHRAERASRGETLEPLPHLLVIIDEFGELLTARPDFIELFLSIGRIGRSIGVHLLLSSQRIEGGKLRGLDTYLSYRIGLRTLSASESQTVLDTPDAFHLPPVPGFGYLKVDTTTYTRFKSGYVSGPLDNPEEQADSVEDVPTVLPSPFYAPTLESGQAQVTGGQSAPGQSSAASKRTTGPTVLSTLMDAMATFPRAVAPIWLPPLPNGISLDTAAGSLVNTSEGLRLSTGCSLKIPVGLLDDPAKQWQGIWELDLTAAGGNLSIVGGPQSGKSTALRTIATSLALTHSPAEVAIYAVDLLGSGMMPLEGLPHVGGVAIRTNREVVRRTVEEIMGMLVLREQVFEKYQVDSLQTLRRMCAKGQIPELTSADVFLLLDGYGQMMDEFEEIESTVHSIIARGGGYGIHVLTTSTRMNEIRISQQSFFGIRIELRLGDPAESSFGRKLAEGISAERPGRALMARKLMGQFALPRIDGSPEADTASQGLRDLVATLSASTDARAMRVRVLPTEVDAATVPTPVAPAQVPLGLRERDLSTLTLDLENKDRHLVILGDEGSGKTNALRSIVRRMVEQHTADELVFAAFDPRRALSEEVPDSYLGGHATSAVLAEQLAAAVSTELQKRMTATKEELAAAPRVVLLIDDYDILTAGGSSPMSRLTPYLPMAADIKLHAVLTRRVRGASRGMYESFFTALRDSGSAALMLSGDHSEGALINGIRARLLPPGRAQYIQAGRGNETIQLFFNQPQEKV